jgi:hypothetical protein
MLPQLFYSSARNVMIPKIHVFSAVYVHQVDDANVLMVVLVLSVKFLPKTMDFVRPFSILQSSHSMVVIAVQTIVKAVQNTDAEKMQKD